MDAADIEIMAYAVKHGAIPDGTCIGKASI
jgi:hypothetical protein